MAKTLHLWTSSDLTRKIGILSGRLTSQSAESADNPLGGTGDADKHKLRISTPASQTKLYAKVEFREGHDMEATTQTDRRAPADKCSKRRRRRIVKPRKVTKAEVAFVDHFAAALAKSAENRVDQD